MNVELLRIGSRRQVADDLVGGEVQDLDGVIVARADEELFAVTGQHDAAGALPDGNGLLDLERGAVDDGDRVALLVGDVDGVGGRLARKGRATHHRNG